MKKKFIFVRFSIDINSGFYSDINHGVACLVPIIDKFPYDVSFLNINSEMSCEEFRNKIVALSPSILGFSCTSHQLKYLIKYSKALKPHPQILQIAGGVGVTLDPDWVLSNSSAKGVCIGEGEIPLTNLLDNIENKRNIFDTEGFYWRIDGRIKKNPVPQFIPDLSVLDFPDYTIFKRNAVVCDGILTITLGRGCPYNCYYCGNMALRSVYPSPKGYCRMPSVEYSIKLLERMIKQYPETKAVIFGDDLLISNKTWFENFAKEYKNRINIPYKLCGRTECINPDIIKALKYSGCIQVSLGIESGDEHLRDYLLNRKPSNELIIEKCKMIKDAGIYLFTFNIVGFPFETGKEMEATLNFNKKISPNGGICTFFYPCKGTELYRICKQQGLLKSEDEIADITNYNIGPCIKMTPQQEKDCIYFQKKISNYLNRQNELTEIAHLFPGLGLNKYFIIVIYQIKSTLKIIPLLYRIVRWFFRISGTKTFIRRLKKNKLK